MTPNFALSLSFDGLRLMHRIEGGWELVGEVALNDPDLTGGLARLHRAADTLEPGGLSTKILLPNEQVKYIALDTTRTEDEDVRAALEGATPYTLDDLAYDYSKGGGRTYIAAVAKETLAEAEAFATEHDFNPVSFVGVPEPFTYMGEPFFGTASTLSEDGFERDSEPVVVIGVADVDLPEPELEPSTQHGSTQEIADTTAPVSDAEIAGDEKTVPADLPVFESAREDTSGPEAAAQPETAPDPEKPESDADTAEEIIDAGETEAGTSERAPQETPGDEVADTAPELDEAEIPAEALDKAADPDQAGPAREGAAPVFGSRRDSGTVRRDPPPLAAPSMQDIDGPPLTAPPVAIDPLPELEQSIVAQTPDVPEDAPAVTGQAAMAVSETQAPALGKTLVATRETAEPTPPAAAETEGTSERGAIGAAGGAVGNMFRSRRMARKAKADAAATEAANAPQDEKSRMTVFGARKTPKPKHKIGGKPRFLGLVLTAALILLLLAVAAFAALNEDVVSRWFGRESDPAPATALAEADAQDAASEVAAAPVSEIDDALPASTTAQDALGADTTAPPTGQVLSPAEAERIYAATGVWQRAPRIPVIPRSEPAADVAVSAGFATPDRKLPGGLLDTNAVGQDPLIAAPVNPPPPDAEFNFGEDGLVIATPEGSVTPDGILVIAGAPSQNPPTRPGTIAPEPTLEEQLAAVLPDDVTPTIDAENGLILISGRPALEPPVRPGTAAPVETSATEASSVDSVIVVSGRPALEPPARPVATPPAAPEAEGLNVIAGRPPLEPPARPVSVAPEAPEQPLADTQEAEGLNLIAGRPPLEPPARPASAPAVEAPTPGGVALSALSATTPRPALRPESVILAAAVAPNVTDLSSGAANVARPQPRPTGLVPDPAPAPEPDPEPEPAQEGALAPGPGGLQLSDEIAAAVQEAASRPDPFATATRQAPASSRRPDTRPRNIDRIVARANEAQQQRAAAAPAVANPVRPTAPTAASVAQAATSENAINLREINLIGIYGSDSDRRAYVRMANGRFRRVSVGDNLDGGRVQSITASQLIYTKRGRNITLEVGG